MQIGAMAAAAYNGEHNGDDRHQMLTELELGLYYTGTVRRLQPIDQGFPTMVGKSIKQAGVDLSLIITWNQYDPRLV